MAFLLTRMGTAILVCVLTAHSSAYWDPFATPPPPTGPPPGSLTCVFQHSTGTYYIDPNQVQTVVDSTNTKCEAYYCDGNTATISKEFPLSATCSTGCVDVAGSTNYCKCLSNCPEGAPAGQNDVCATNNPCENGGTCSTMSDGSFSCACPAGYKGDSCQIDECDSYCLNGGTCYHDSSRSTGMKCECATGYLDTKCETPRCNSSFNPCHNGGVCQMDSTSPTGYSCRCPQGYSGSHCETVSTCGESWTQHGLYCYKAFDMKLTYDDALNRCQDEGAIVSPSQSQDENFFLRGLLIGGLWIGVTDRGQEGAWLWTDNSPAFTNSDDFTAWKSGEPDDLHGEETNADCVVSNSNGNWLDIPCSNKKVFVCRKNI